MAASAGSRWQHACMAASANTRLLVVFVAVHVPLYSFLCKQVWDGAHPCWDAFTGLCVYIKSSSNQIESSVTYDPKSSFYDTSPEQRQHINSKKMRTNRPHDVAHASVPVIPSRERVDAAHGRPWSTRRTGLACNRM